MLDLQRVLWSVTFLMENIYVQFEDRVYQQIVGIPMGTNCAPLITDLFLYCYEKDFMSNLHKSKKLDLVDKYKDTSDILMIYLPSITPNLNNISPIYIYPTELQINKENACDKETPFLDLNI